MASSVENRIARALPVFRTDRFGKVMPIFSDSSVRVMRRAYSTSSSFTLIGMSDRSLEILPHLRPVLEHPREYEEQQDREPPGERIIPADTHRHIRGRHACGHADHAQM